MLPALLIVLCCGKWLNITNYSIELDSVVDAAKTPDGNLWVVDNGGSRILEINPEYEVINFFSVESQLEVKQIVSTAKGQVYIRTVTVQEQNNGIGQESIFLLDKRSGKMEAVLECEYEESILRNEILQMCGLGDTLQFAVRSDEGIEFYSIDGDYLAGMQMKNAELWICSAVLDEKANGIYYCMQNGQILFYDLESEDSVLLYDGSKNKDTEGIPRYLTITENGQVYFTDIGLRRICTFEDGQAVVTRECEEQEELDRKEKEIFYQVNAEHGMAAVSAYGVFCQQDEEWAGIYEFDTDTLIKVKIVVGKIALLLLSMTALYFIFLGILMFLHKSSKLVKIMTAVCVMIAILTVLFLVMIIPQYKEQVSEEIKERSQEIAFLSAKQIPLEALMNIDSVSDFMSEDYVQVKEAVNAIFLDESSSVNDFYCILYTVRDGVITVNYSTDESCGAVYPYDWPYEGAQEQSIYESKEGMVFSTWNSSEGNYTFALYPVLNEEEKVEALIEVGINTESFDKMLNSIILDLLITVAVIAAVFIFIILEALIFLKGRNKYAAGRGGCMPNELLRTLVFLIFMVTNMTTSFLAVYAISLVQSNKLTLPEELMASLPISAEVIAGAVFSLTGSHIIDRLGQRRAAICGAVVMVTGMFLRVIPDFWLLTAGQMLIGSGWGIILLIVNMQISQNEEEKDEGFAGYSAAAFNGINCGVVLGGFLMRFFTRSQVILIAAGCSLLIVLHVTKYIVNIQVRGETEKSGISTLQFLCDKKVWSYLAFLVFPVIACGYFLNYMYPILGERLGMNESYVGYSYLINGLFVLCLGNLLTGLISRHMKKQTGLLLSVLLYGVTFLIVAEYENTQSLFMALALLGIADSFGLPLQSSYYTDLEAVRKYGYDKSMGIYSLVENTAQSLGAILFGYIFVLGVDTGLKMLAGVICVLAVIFVLISCTKKKKKE
jgi:predicted MFS family arabinose efflux permease